MGELAVRGIRAGYGQRTVVADLSAEFPRASVTVVLGPGGSGKSTLLRVLAGSSPELWSAGEIPRVSALLLPQATRKVGRSEDAALVAAARVVVQAWFAEHSTVLSADHRGALLASSIAVVRVAKIVASEAELVLLDEPDSGLEGPVALALAKLLRALARAGRTIILVTHNLALVDHVADHVLLLIDGVKLDEGPLARVRELPASNRVRDFFIWGT